MSRLSLTASIEKIQLAAPFRISGYVFTHIDAVIVTLSDGVHVGRGEAAGVYYLGDDSAHMMGVLNTHRDAIEAGLSRQQLLALMPPGGARNAVDCALWELEAKQAGKPVWQLAGIAAPRPLVTTFTLGADEPALMAEQAKRHAQARSIKIKLTGELALDIERVRAVRNARPDVWIGIDANQGFKIAELDSLVAAMVELRVSLIEQPLARGREADLEGYQSPIPLAADESALTLADVPGLVGRFQVVNIKLDKCGGLTEGLAIAEAARKHGLQVMVGNMGGTSLASAPAFVLGQVCDLVDLDGPIFIATDRTPGVVYADGYVTCGDDVWGATAASSL